MAERAVKDFMITRSGQRTRPVLAALCLLILLTTLGSCTPDLTDDPIPYLPFSPIQINLNLPEYIKLRSDRGSVYIEGGVQGIILYRENATTYLAYERNCSFQPNNACVIVEIDQSTLFMLDPCCSSTFDFSTGLPTGGPAWRPLRRYETILNGSELTITDNMVE